MYQYCPEMWYLRPLEHASGIQKQAILEIVECQSGLVYCPILVYQYPGHEVPFFFIFLLYSMMKY